MRSPFSFKIAKPEIGASMLLEVMVLIPEASLFQVQPAFTSPISYKCGADQDCSNANTYNANGPSGTGSVHFRASIFDGECNKTGDDENCEAPCVCTPPTNVIVTEIGNDQLQVCWDAQECADGYILQYQWKGHSNWLTVDVIITRPLRNI
jgi:hypothetical protein